MTKREIQQRKDVAKKIAGNIDMQLALDEMIIERHNRIASNLNNSGTEAQIEWLQEVDCETLKSILDAVKE